MIIAQTLILTIAALLALFGNPAQCAGDIVYSARYYQKSGQSSFHIYRINPDATGRKQITSGPSDDKSPVWSSDGKTIWFIRSTGSADFICSVGANGGALKKHVAARRIQQFKVAPDGQYVAYIDDTENLKLFNLVRKKTYAIGKAHFISWSPTGEYIYSGSPSGGSITDLQMGETANVLESSGAGVWIDKYTAAVYSASQSGPGAISIVSYKGTIKSSVEVAFTQEADCPSDFPDALYRIPGKKDVILFARHCGSSAGGSGQVFYSLNLNTGEAVKIARGNALSWGGGATSFITGSARTLANLDSNKQVWTSTLSIVYLNSKNKRTIVSGLVEVSGQDWRKPVGLAQSGK